MEIFAVLRDGGSHDGASVISVWSTRELAQREADRLNVDITPGDEYEVREWTLDVTGDGRPMN